MGKYYLNREVELRSFLGVGDKGLEDVCQSMDHVYSQQL